MKVNLNSQAADTTSITEISDELIFPAEYCFSLTTFILVANMLLPAGCKNIQVMHMHMHLK